MIWILKLLSGAIQAVGILGCGFGLAAFFRIPSLFAGFLHKILPAGDNGSVQPINGALPSLFDP
jgi:hypothetical protein